jgi:hypothetical protein
VNTQTMNTGEQKTVRLTPPRLLSPLPRPDLADTAVTELPPRQFVMLPDTSGELIRLSAPAPAVQPAPPVRRPRGAHRACTHLPRWVDRAIVAGLSLPVGALLGIAMLWAVAR